MLDKLIAFLAMSRSVGPQASGCLTSQAAASLEAEASMVADVADDSLTVELIASLFVTHTLATPNAPKSPTSPGCTYGSLHAVVRVALDTSGANGYVSTMQSFIEPSSGRSSSR